jgi:hypothetical protein
MWSEIRVQTKIIDFALNIFNNSLKTNNVQ